MSIVLKFFKVLLSLRYRVTITGDKHLRKTGPILVMPNHVALVDPQIILTYLSKMKLHPVVQSSFYNIPVLHQLFKALGAIPINNGVTENITRDEIDSSLHAVKDAIKQGKNIILYPSGGLKKQATESIIGKKSAYDIVSNIDDDVRILLIRITGLRGSSSSKAWMGDTPSLAWFFLKGLFSLIVNLIFFVPKRNVDIEIIDITDDAKKKVTKGLDDFNHRLESVYNKKGPESLEYLSHYFFFNDVENKKLPDIIGSNTSLQQTVDYSILQYPHHILEAITNHIKTIKPEYKKEITPQTHVILDMYFDSLDTAELKSFVQSTYPESSNPPLLDLKLVGDYIVMALGHSTHVDPLKPCAWNYPLTNELLYEVVSTFTDTDTIPGLIKKVFSRHKSRSFCYDQVFGVQSRKDFGIKAYLIADLIKKMPGDYIGIMLPSLSGTSLLIVATYLAGKVPVMLNWTQGQAAFDHCAGYKQIPGILTSKKFYSKIEAPHYEKYNLIFLEEMLKKISIWQKVKALCNANIFHIPKQTKEAVILFTSGSDALPKAVSISHQNIIQNAKGALAILDLQKDDILLGFLPPFHSFGFSVNTILPLITGMRIVYSPDPNDSKTLANVIEHTKVNGVTSTPTFMKKILSAATSAQMKSLKFVITGAEKCPAGLFDLLHTMVPQALIIEGYGITECSPIISANPMDHIKPGTVGIPIIGLDLKILDLDTLSIMKTGEEGMIYVSGPSVFEGYLDPKVPNPFMLYNNKKYYRTGDMGYVDNDGYLTITGRLKRFIKLSGEMVSLPFLEGILSEKFGKKDELSFAIEAKENGDGTAVIVAFTTTDDVQVSDINTYLRKQGVSNLIHIAEVRKIDVIPVLGSGKTDYKVLKAMIV